MERNLIDISGAHGQDGRDGDNGIGSGADGQDAGPSTKGKSAGNADIRITRVPNKLQALRVTGTVLDKPFDKVYELGFEDFLHIHAIGGNGGRGGDGGRG